jgi:hypothetical protein
MMKKLQILAEVAHLSADKLKLLIGFEMVFPGPFGLIASGPGTLTILAAQAHSDFRIVSTYSITVDTHR